MGTNDDFSPSELCTVLLALALPQLVEDEDLLGFLTDELAPALAAPICTPASIDNLIGQHLVDLGLCPSELDRELVCESLHQALLQPGEAALEAAKQLHAGVSLQSAVSPQSSSADEQTRPDVCQLCERLMPLTAHHYFPRAVQDKYVKRGLMRESDRTHTLLCCRQCHNTIHRLYDHETLASRLNSLEALQGDEAVQKWVRYASKQKARALPGMRVAR